MQKHYFKNIVEVVSMLTSVALVKYRFFKVGFTETKGGYLTPKQEEKSVQSYVRKCLVSEACYSISAVLRQCQTVAMALIIIT